MGQGLTGPVHSVRGARCVLAIAVVSPDKNHLTAAADISIISFEVRRHEPL
jgi:hypothetical protein